MKRKILITANPTNRSNLLAKKLKSTLEHSGFLVVDEFCVELEIGCLVCCLGKKVYNFIFKRGKLYV